MKYNFFRRFIISGLLVWLPIVVTVWVVSWVFHLLNSSLSLLPVRFNPDHWFGAHIPGLGVVLTLSVIFLTGMLVTNFIGDFLVAWWDRLISHIPLVRTVHSSVKQVLNTLIGPGGKSFHKAVLVEWPREGMWSVGFETGNSCPEVNAKTNDETLVSIFVIATPNPTSGFLMMVPRKDVIDLDMGVDQALKFILSIGVIQPGDLKKLRG